MSGVGGLGRCCWEGGWGVCGGGGCRGWGVRCLEAIAKLDHVGNREVLEDGPM